MNYRLLITLFLAVFLATGCTGPKKPAAKPPEASKQAEASSTQETSDSTAPAGKNEMSNYPSQDVSLDVSIHQPDNIILHGKLYDPVQVAAQAADSGQTDAGKNNSPSPPKKYPLVILLHTLNGSSSDWGTVPKKLVSAGYAVFAVDLPGHGASDHLKSGRLYGWRDFQNEDWKDIPTIVERIRSFFAANPDDYSQIQTDHLAIIGASLGANIAMNAAAKYPDRIQTLVLLSPGFDYKGLSVSDPILHYKNTIEILSSNQGDSNDASDALYHWALGKKAMKIYHGIGDGTDMLAADPKIATEIVDWLQKTYPGVSSSAAPPQETAAPKAAENTDVPTTPQDKPDKSEKK